MNHGSNFLSAYPRISMSRAIEGATTGKKENIEGVIKMLAVVSSPLDLKEHERLQIENEMMFIL